METIQKKNHNSCENKAVEVVRDDQQRMAVPEILIKMESMIETDEESRLQDDLLDIKQDPLDPEQQLDAAYISSDGSARENEAEKSASE